MENFEDIGKIPEVESAVGKLVLKEILKGKLEFYTDQKEITVAIKKALDSAFKEWLSEEEFYIENKQIFDELIAGKEAGETRKAVQNMGHPKEQITKVLNSDEFRIFQKHFERVKNLGSADNILDLDNFMAEYGKFIGGINENKFDINRMAFEIKRSLDEIIRKKESEKMGIEGPGSFKK